MIENSFLVYGTPYWTASCCSPRSRTSRAQPGQSTHSGYPMLTGMQAELVKEGCGLRACGPCLCGEHGAAAPCPGVTGPWGHLAVHKLEAVLYLAARIMCLYLTFHRRIILVSDSLAHRMDQERLWLGLPLAMVPEDTLPSEKTVLRALHGLFEKKHKEI